MKLRRTGLTLLKENNKNNDYGACVVRKVFPYQIGYVVYDEVVGGCISISVMYFYITMHGQYL